MTDLVLEDDPTRLENVLLDVARDLLLKHGAFHPVALVIAWPGGEIEDVDLGDKHPLASDYAARLVDQLRKRAHKGEISAAGVAIDSFIAPGRRDAVACHVDHVGFGGPRTLLVPYLTRRRRLLKKEFEFQPGDWLPGEARWRIFDADQRAYDAMH